MAIFIGGLSMHVSQAILSHLFSIDMSWGATAKEVDNSTFFEEVPKILNKFRFTFAFCILMAAGMIVLGVQGIVPEEWRITEFVAIWPAVSILASHFFLPILLVSFQLLLQLERVEVEVEDGLTRYAESTTCAVQVVEHVFQQNGAAALASSALHAGRQEGRNDDEATTNRRTSGGFSYFYTFFTHSYRPGFLVSLFACIDLGAYLAGSRCTDRMERWF